MSDKKCESQENIGVLFWSSIDFFLLLYAIITVIKCLIELIRLNFIKAKHIRLIMMLTFTTFIDRL